MKLSVFDIDYIIENNRGIIRLFCKDEKGNTILALDKNFKSYFYVESDNLVTLKKRIEKSNFKDISKLEIVNKIISGKSKKLLKIFVENPRLVYDIRDKIKHWKESKEEYEYTIPVRQRYVFDKKIEPMGWVEINGKEIKNENYLVDKVIEINSLKPIEKDILSKTTNLAFDIETSDKKIIMISIVDNKGFKKVLTTQQSKYPEYVEVLKDEKQMLQKFLEIIKQRDPDIILGYNTDNFDFQKIRERAEELKIDLKIGRDNSNIRFVRRGRFTSTKIRGRSHIDLFNFIDHILSPKMKTEVLTLDAVCQEMLGQGKEKIKWKDIKESWENKKDLERITKYSLRDSELTLLLSEQLLPQIFALSKLTSLTPFDASRYTYSQLVEAYLSKNAVANNIIIPNRPKYDQIKQRQMKPIYKGGFVIEPEKGIHENIIVFDFRSLYPTIIITHNISPETLNCKCCKQINLIPESKNYFCKKIKGFIPINLEHIIKKRMKIKEKMKNLKENSEEYKRLYNMQYSLKIIANSTYGYFGYPGSRWYCYECASASAALGRYYIKKIIDIIKKENYQVIYGDTDSVFIKIPNIPKDKLISKAKELLKKINNQLPGIIELEFRGLYKAGIFVTIKGEKRGAKKRYALLDYDNNLEIRGFETVRRDWCDLAKNIQHEILRIILEDKKPEKAIELVRKTIDKIKSGKATIDELTIYTQLTMPLENYRQISPHVSVAKKMRKQGKPVGEGMIIEYIITKGSGSISERAEPIEDVKTKYDPDYYINHQILPAAMRVFQALGIDEKQVLSGKLQANLGKWFK
ncbi:MAG: ribonuclease H-like domain-containing protein [Candidatus Aenigmarchaeota archaeon]|nr:ribonuclease H-like domain-containing protein [Candidatus Aenigmarchaeota archaeon]